MKKIEYDIYDDNILKFHQNINLDDYDVIVKSPVITDQNEIIKQAIISKVKIITDIELFYQFFPWKTYITVTGTNGKTTTVNLIAKVIGNIDLGGNLGKPIFDFCNSYKDIVVEASSFMLEFINHYHSKINILLNLSPNHLDHHHTYSAYIRSKLKLFKNLTKNDYVIYNYDDLLIRRLVKYLDCHLIPFSVEEEVDGGYLKGQYILFRKRLVMTTQDIILMGKHNISNILAGICAGLCYDSSLLGIEESVKTFKPIEHRIEYIGQINSIKIYNDSKSTNYKALKIALDSFDNEKILLICGGKFREDKIEELNNSISNIAYVLTNGENGCVMGAYFKSKGIKVTSFMTLDAAMDKIDEYVDGITMILFSPGAASYDQFKNYEERGKYFKSRIVFNKLR